MKVLHTNTLMQLAELSADAIAVIRNILTDEKASPSLKLRAAKMVLDAAAAIEDSNDEHAQTESTDVPARNTAPPAGRPVSPNAAKPQVVEISAAPPRHRNKVGRNEPCPCGSGTKYKKCCLLKPRERAPHCVAAAAA